MRSCPACGHIIWPWQRKGQCERDQTPAHFRCHEVVHKTIAMNDKLIKKLQSLFNQGAGLPEVIKSNKSKKSKNAVGVF